MTAPTEQPAVPTIVRLSHGESEMIRLAAGIRQEKMQAAQDEMAVRMEMVRKDHGVADGVRFEIIDTDDPEVLALSFVQDAAQTTLALVKDAPVEDLATVLAQADA